VINPEQLAAALERLDPRDRELLALSLRRRVPDEALARMYDIAPPEIARRRAGAIERLADELEIQRGEDLGHVLKALLEEEIWSATGPPPGEEFSGKPKPPAVAPAPSEPVPELSAVPERKPVPAVASEAAEPSKAAEASQPAESSEAAKPSKAAEASQPAPTPAPPPAPEDKPGEGPERKPIPHLALAVFGIGIAALLAAIVIVSVAEFGDDGRAAEGGSGTGDGTRHFVPQSRGPMAAPFPTEPQEISCYSTAYVRRAATLYRRPGGKPRMRVAAKTEWGSPRVFGVVRRKDDWLAIQAPELRNEEVAWLRASQARLDCVTWSVHADLSKRMLFVRREGRTVRRMRVAIGRPGNSTPRGRFSVTDKLRVTDPDSPYGCCVLALTGHQTNLPADWPGGDRLAVHATRDLASIGRPASLGCLRMRSRQARWLIETIPLGTPVFVQA
jgi:L,D-transpeptidase catalytic domain